MAQIRPSLHTQYHSMASQRRASHVRSRLRVGTLLVKTRTSSDQEQDGPRACTGQTLLDRGQTRAGHEVRAPRGRAHGVRGAPRREQRGRRRRCLPPLELGVGLGITLGQ
eukprot:2786874-Pyramimonas_sp.AAC.1